MPTKYVTLYIQARQADEEELRDITVTVPVNSADIRNHAPTVREIEKACDKLGNALERLLTFDFHDHNPPDDD